VLKQDAEQNIGTYDKGCPCQVGPCHNDIVRPRFVDGG